ncbi:MAG: type II toxin-antitoxin system RelE/ParE family toxin [Thiomargarita sp.]|nr:type II toxin-antitoxin system RelE/ParE family toxin [Thiomargarita sp.]
MDSVLITAVAEMEQGLIDAELGDHVVKKRIPLPGRGKRGGARTILAYRIEDKAFFIYGFAKNRQDNLNATELESLQILAADVLGYDNATLKKMVEQKKLIEVNNDE